MSDPRPLNDTSKESERETETAIATTITTVRNPQRTVATQRTVARTERKEARLLLNREHQQPKRSVSDGAIKFWRRALRNIYERAKDEKQEKTSKINEEYEDVGKKDQVGEKLEKKSYL